MTTSPLSIGRFVSARARCSIIGFLGAPTRPKAQWPPEAGGRTFSINWPRRACRPRAQRASRPGTDALGAPFCRFGFLLTWLTWSSQVSGDQSAGLRREEAIIIMDSLAGLRKQLLFEVHFSDCFPHPPRPSQPCCSSSPIIAARPRGVLRQDPGTPFAARSSTNNRAIQQLSGPSRPAYLPACLPACQAGLLSRPGRGAPGSWPVR